MTFGEHLEELRGRIIFSLIAFAVAFTVAMVFQEELMAFFTRPYERARASVNESLIRDWATKPHTLSTEERLVDRLFALLSEKKILTADETAELAKLAAKEHEPRPPQLPTLSAVKTGETFGAYMLEAGLAAALIAAPVLLFQLWRFIAAGLYDSERGTVMRVLPFSLGLFFVGLAFGYFVLAELSVRFLISYGDITLVSPNVTIGNYLDLLFLLLLVMGLVFQIPLIMTVLSAVGLVPPSFYKGKRRHFILAIFVVAAVITPPDYISQLLVAGPMLVLFEAGVWLATGAARRRALAKQQKPVAS